LAAEGLDEYFFLHGGALLEEKLMLWQGEGQFTVNRQHGRNAPVRTAQFRATRNGLLLRPNGIDKQFRLLNLEIREFGAKLHNKLIRPHIFPVVNQGVPEGF
jgi:hypothetical protein